MKEVAPVQLVIVGHVDHGKSTLIGRLLYDTESLPPEKMDEIRKASLELGHDVEFAYVMDHLEEERRQEMTVDTAQAFFQGNTRDYVIIDAPGHKELMRNMVTGAAQADAAVLVVDAAEGVMEQTQRHATFLSLLGIRQLIVFLNKMDKVEYSEERFTEMSEATERLLTAAGLKSLGFVPGSALHGENVACRSKHMAWYEGSSLLEALSAFAGNSPSGNGKPLRFPIQDVYALNGQDILVGRVESGCVTAGQDVLFLPSRLSARVTGVEVFGQDRSVANQGECIGITIDKKPVPVRGEVACAGERDVCPTTCFRASVFWMAEEPFRKIERFTVRVATQEVPCRVERIETRMDSATCEILEENARQLNETEIGTVVLRSEQSLILEPFSAVPELGRLVLTRGGATVGGGLVVDANVS